jgi:hypothetical protein
MTHHRNFIGLGLLAALATLLTSYHAAHASGALETNTLPRPAGAVPVHESPLTTLYRLPLPTDTAGNAVAAALDGAGLERYVSPFQRSSADIAAINLTFRKGPHGLRVRIAPAPALAGATVVNLVTFPLRHDIPSPPAASDLKFDPDRPHLEAMTTEVLAAIFEFYQKELGSRGWDLHRPDDGSVPAIAGDQAAKRAFYTRSGQRPLMLQVLRQDDGRTLVKLEAVPPSVLPGTKLSQRNAPAASPPARPTDDATERQIDALVSDALQQAGEQIREALRDAEASRLPHGLARPPAESRPEGRPSPPAPGAAGSRTAATPSTSGPTTGRPPPSQSPTAAPAASAALPMPPTARRIRTDTLAGKLQFETPAPTVDIAAFYRVEMPKRGWTFERSPVDRQTMIAQIYGKDGATLTITIARTGTTTNVFAEGETLKAPAASRTQSGTPSPSASATAQEPPLEIADSGGLLVPKPHSSVGRTTSLFRKEASAFVPAGIAPIVAFYRQELVKRGWKELPGATVCTDTASLRFTSPDGPAQLTLKRADDGTSVTLAVRQETQARKSGLMPRRGFGRLLLGNITAQAGTVVIDGKTIKVGPEAGQKGTDGPHIELPAGTYKAHVRVGTASEYTETVTLGRDEIWGLLLGPNGALFVQAY